MNKIALVFVVPEDRDTPVVDFGSIHLFLFQCVHVLMVVLKASFYPIDSLLIRKQVQKSLLLIGAAQVNSELLVWQER